MVCCLRYIFWANDFRERGLELLVANSLTQCVLVFCILCIVSSLGLEVCWVVCLRVCVCVCVCVCGVCVVCVGMAGYCNLHVLCVAT